eukprot:10420693-Alexandrium_andersonii.AAC.1
MQAESAQPWRSGSGGPPERNPKQRVRLIRAPLIAPAQTACLRVLSLGNVGRLRVRGLRRPAPLRGCGHVCVLQQHGPLDDRCIMR